MTIRAIGGAETGLNSATATASEFDAVSVVAGGTFASDSGYTAAGSLYSLKAQTAGTAGVSYGEIDWSSDDQIIYVCVWVKFLAVPSAITAFLSVTDSVPTQLFSLRVNASGFWQLQNDANSTTYTSTTQKPLANVWHRVEVYWKQHASAGEFTVKIDNFADPDLTQTGLNNGTALPRRLRLGVVESQASAPARYLDNWIVKTDGWIGRSFVGVLRTISTDVGGGNWTVVDAGGTIDWQVLDERPWASGTSDMIKSSTANQEDRMGLNPIGITSGPTVMALMPMIRHRRAVAGSAAAVTIYIRNGSTDGTASASLDAGGTTFKTFRGAIQETDPNTGAAWTLAGVNTAILKIVHDAGTNEAQINAAFVYAAVQPAGGVIVSPLMGTKQPPRTFLKPTRGRHRA